MPLDEGREGRRWATLARRTIVMPPRGGALDRARGE